jgi:hypothetical protein
LSGDSDGGGDGYDDHSLDSDDDLKEINQKKKKIRNPSNRNSEGVGP